MYGQKAQFGAVAAGITVASWWMWSVTVVMAVIAVALLVRVFFTLRPGREVQRP